MGLEKVATTVGKEIIAYAKTSGSKSLLTMKPIKINTKSLGYIHPNGEIAFQTTDVAISYAKTKVIRALKSKNPYEYNVEIKGSRIINESKGNCDTFSRSTDSPLTIGVHGHPDTYSKGCTTAPSGSDYYCLMSNPNQTKEIIFNSNGEYYIMEKIPNFHYNSNYIMGYYTEYDIKMIKHLFSKKSKAIQEELKQAIQNKNETVFNELLSKHMPKTPKDISIELVDLTHSFWLKNAKELGIKITTNFSNFKNLLSEKSLR